MLVQWLVLADWGWMPVGDQDTLFTRALRENISTFTYEYEVEGTTHVFYYRVDLTTMTQMNIRTQTVRPLRMRILEISTYEEASTLVAALGERAHRAAPRGTGGEPSGL